MHSTYYSILISSARLMQRFDVLNELTVSLALHEEMEGYVTFLEDMDKQLPVCETLIVSIFKSTHAPAAMMLHLLRRCSCIRRFKLLYDWRTPSTTATCNSSGCPCILPESYRMDDSTFDALEEIEISFFTGSTEEEEFAKLLLSRCNMVTLKRVDLNVPFVPVSSEIMEVVEGIRSMCCMNSKVQFKVLAKEVPMLYKAY